MLLLFNFLVPHLFSTFGAGTAVYQPTRWQAKYLPQPSDRQNSGKTFTGKGPLFQHNQKTAVNIITDLAQVETMNPVSR